MPVIDDLRRRRSALISEGLAVTQRAAAENRALAEGENAEYQRISAELDTIDARLGEVSEVEQRQVDTNRAFGALERRPAMPGLFARGGDGELREFLSGRGPKIFEVAPKPVDWRQVQARNLLSGSGTGNNVVPTDFYDRLVQHMVATSPILQIATVVNTSGGAPLAVPKTSAHPAAKLTAEGATIGETDPAFDQVTLGGYKYGSFVMVSRELLEDSGVDLEGYLAQRTAEALGNAFGMHAATGDGVSKPRGYATDATAGVTGGTGAAPTFDDIVSLYMSILPAYRRRATWLANDATIAELRKLVTTGSGEPLLSDPRSTDGTMTIYGRPVVSDPNLPDIGTGAKSLFFGDFEQYFVRLAGGIRFERSDDYAFQEDMVSFRALMRADGALIDTSGAVKYYTSG